MATGEEQEQAPASGGISDTRHEAHEHALPRVVWGVIALLVVLGGVLVWEKWGESIKEACFGDSGACVVEGFAPTEGATFDPPEGF